MVFVKTLMQQQVLTQPPLTQREQLSITPLRGMLSQITKNDRS
jgi:hypothetical protein